MLFPESPVIRAVERMRSNKVDSLMVVDRNEKFLGIMRSKDIRPKEIQGVYVKDFMREPRITADPQEDIVSVLTKLQKISASSVPVIDGDGCLQGLITKSSLISTMSLQFIPDEEEAPQDL